MKNLLDKLSKKSKKVGKCIEFQGCLNHDGYGVLIVNRKRVKAHRLAYLLAHPDFDQSLVVCHECDNRKCINVKHLFAATQAVNMQDKVEKGRQTKGETHPRYKDGKYSIYKTTKPKDINV